MLHVKSDKTWNDIFGSSSSEFWKDQILLRFIWCRKGHRQQGVMALLLHPPTRYIDAKTAIFLGISKAHIRHFWKLLAMHMSYELRKLTVKLKSLNDFYTSSLMRVGYSDITRSFTGRAFSVKDGQNVMLTFLY